MAVNTYNSTLATDPLRTFRFNATFSSSDGTANTAIQTGATGFSGGFTTVSGLSITTQNIEYREGGMNTTVHQVPGMTTFQPIVFSRGAVAANDQGITWMRSLFAAASGAGVVVSGGSGFRVNILLTVNSHPNAVDATVNAPQLGFKIHNAWITNLTWSDLDAQNGAIFFERMTLIHEGISAFRLDGSETNKLIAGVSGLTPSITIP